MAPIKTITAVAILAALATATAHPTNNLRGLQQKKDNKYDQGVDDEGGLGGGNPNLPGGGRRLYDQGVGDEAGFGAGTTTIPGGKDFIVSP